MAKKILSGKDNTNGFQKNPQNINRTGANRKTLSSVNKQLEEAGLERVKLSDIIQLYELLFNATEEELKQLSDDKNVAMTIRIVIKEMLSKNGFDVIEKVIERAFGKVKSDIDNSSQTEIIRKAKIWFEKNEND